MSVYDLNKLRALILKCGKKAAAMPAALLYPARCPVCDRLLTFRLQNNGEVCPSCLDSLPWIVQPYCMKCGKVVKDPRREYCEDCLNHSHVYDRGIAAFQYTGSMRDSIRRMKFGNRRDYLDFYAGAMLLQGNRWLRIWEPDAIIPVPMHWKKRNRRGFNQSELLAEKIGQKTGIPVRKDIIKKCRDTKDQKRLSLQERRKNLAGAFILKKSPDDIHTALIVDDVYTTGSTMDAIAAVLRQGGVKHIYFLTICTGKG